jgi:hypothetical protein
MVVVKYTKNDWSMQDSNVFVIFTPMKESEIIKFGEQLFSVYPKYRMEIFPSRHFAPELLLQATDPLVERSAGLIKSQIVGHSFEKRPIRLISVGSGTIIVLLWSQMHGDESTATMAICDILNYLLNTQSEKTIRTLLSKLTLNFLPMLNPDGAARCQRRTALGIDMNRDAVALATPEARLLQKLQHELKPHFGFNLHDQELSTVSSSKEISAIGLLAPAFDTQKSYNEVRARAKHLAATFASVMNQFVPGKVTKYDDAFEPRAFGDNMQKWGTSTLLVESGHSIGDPEKDYTRRLNFTGILASLYAIATETLSMGDDVYEQLPFNGKRAYDVVVRNVIIKHEDGSTAPADLGISYQVDTHSELPSKLVDIGDLTPFVGLREIDGRQKVIPQMELIVNQAFEWERHFK